MQHQIVQSYYVVQQLHSALFDSTTNFIVQHQMAKHYSARFKKCNVKQQIQCNIKIVQHQTVQHLGLGLGLKATALKSGTLLV